jgi:hypothetical protein
MEKIKRAKSADATPPAGIASQKGTASFVTSNADV